MDRLLGVGEMAALSRGEHPLDPSDLPVVEIAERSGDLFFDRLRCGACHRVSDGRIELGAFHRGDRLSECAGHQATSGAGM